MKKFTAIISFIAFLISQPAFSAFISNPKYLDDLNKQFERQKILVGSHFSEYESAIDLITDPDERQAFQYICAYSPLSDMADYTPDFVRTNACIAVKALREMPWGKNIPEDVYLHFVLPHRINNENLDSFRIIMYDSLKTRLSGMNLHDAALEVNHWCHEHVTYRGSDERTSAPLSTIRTSFGRCGEESTLLVTALRTVGIPARQVYTPRWAHCDDNHAWVEAWIDGRWCFMGACEPSPEVNMGWFSVPATRTMLVNTRAFGAYFGNEDVIYRGDRFSELNVIKNYVNPKEIKISVKDNKGKKSINAKVSLLLYNYAEFYPLADIYTDSTGIATFKTGYGDLLVRASKDGLYAISKLPANSKELTLAMEKNPKFSHKEFDLTPPNGINQIMISTEKAKINEKRLLVEDSIRNNYMASFYDITKAESLRKELNMQDTAFDNILIHSYGNYAEIIKFLRDTPQNLRPRAMDLLNSISEKDLHDTRASILENHLNGAMEFYNDFSDKEIWKNYILSGRIYIEMMKSWRSIGDSVLLLYNDMSRENFKKLSPDKQISMILANINFIKIDSISNAHSRAPLTPMGVFRLQCADPISRDIFFVSVCRSLGIPARLNDQTTIPQYYMNGKWNDVSFEKLDKQAPTDYGSVHFINKSDFEPKYYSNFTIGRVLLPNFKTIEYEDIMPISQMQDKIEVPVGNYILVTGNRDSDGKVYASVDFFDVNKNNTTNVEVKVRNLPKAENAWGKIDLSEFNTLNITRDMTVNLKETCGNNPFVLAVIEPDKEPTKHVMADLKSSKKAFEKWNGHIIFVIPEEKVNDGFSAATFPGLPANCVFVIDKTNAVLNKIEQLRNADNLISDLPIITYGNSMSELIYFSKGYRIGTINDLEKLISHK